jgi:hypothetical protein
MGPFLYNKKEGNRDGPKQKKNYIYKIRLAKGHSCVQITRPFPLNKLDDIPRVAAGIL